MKPAWLPNTISLDGEWEKTLNKLYLIFVEDFIKGKPKFGDRSVWWDQNKYDGRFEEGFWHVISAKDHATQERIPDFERAKRLPWCAPVVLNYQDPQIKCWDFQEGRGKIRTYIWLEQWDYLVILEKRSTRNGEIAFLITAYFISGSSSRKKLTQKYEQRV